MLSESIEADYEELPGTSESHAANQHARGTLDEGLMDTVRRDFREVNAILREVVYRHFPCSSYWSPGNDQQAYELSNKADLWTPLLFVFVQSAALSWNDEKLYSKAFILTWAVIGAMATHAKLAKNREQHVWWLTYVTMAGYCMFPLVLCSVANRLLYPVLAKLLFSGAWGLRALVAARLLTFALTTLWSFSCICAATSCTGFVEKYPLFLCLTGLGSISVAV